MENKQVGQSQNTANNTGLESLEQVPATSRVAPISASKNPSSRPTRPWKKQAMLLAVVLLFVGGLGIAALQLAGKVKNAGKNQDAFDSYKTVNNPVLGNDTLLPVQSLNDQTVTINGDLTVQGKLNLSAQALNDLASILGNTVRLTPVLGGPAQAGNINISGGVMASTFQGNGANLSDLNASSITSGTLNNERLDASVTKLGQTIPLSALQSTVLSSLNGISNNGAASIIGTGSVTVSTDIANGVITIDSVAGDITGVAVGSGLLGGGTSGDVTLNLDTGIVTMQGNTFNGANQLVKLGSSGELPVISATNLTNLNASNLSTGTVNDSRLSTNVTVQGNSFNGTNQLVKLNGAGELPSLSATNLTNLNASNIGTGTLNDARLGGNVTLQGNTFNLANKLVQLDSSGNLPSLNGSAITNLNAGNVSSGTLADARLSANVALLNANQTFTGNVVFSQPLSVNVIQPSAAMTIGATNQALTLQGDLTTKLTGTGGTGTVSLGFTGTPVGNVVYQLDASAPAGTYTLCTSVGNCAGSGDGVTSPGGTTNKIAKFVGGQAVGDSSISDDGLLVTVGANALYKAGADSTTAFRVQNAAGSTNVFTVDSTNTRVAIGQSTANYTLDVNGDINSATGLRVGGNLVCDSNGCSASGSSGFYIQNSATTQTAANFNIESTSNSTPTAVLKLKSSQTADLLQARDASNAVIAKIDASGNISTTGQFQVNGTQISSANLSNDSNIAKLNGAQTFSAANLFKNASDSTSAFRIQNAAASNLFVADTTNSRIAIGQATAGYTLDVNGDINITNGSSYRINGVAICGPTATCAPSSGSGSYVQNGLTVQTANMNIQSASSSAVVAVVQGATGQTADLLQARDSNNNVVAKITSSGAIYQGTNQVCDTSNNCNYAVGSGSGNYIQNGSTTQTANMNIQSANAAQVTAVIQGAGAQTADILQVRDGTSAGNTLFGINQNTVNLIANSSFETDTNGWTGKGTGTVSRVVDGTQYNGNAYMRFDTAVSTDGAKYAYQFAPSTTYTLSFYVHAFTSSITGLQSGRSDDGTTNTNCTGTVVSTISQRWIRNTCTFTTGSTISPNSYIYIARSGAATGLAIDAVQLELGSSASAYSQGQIALNGTITSPITLQNAYNSTTAFQVLHENGTVGLNYSSSTSTLTLGQTSSSLVIGGSSITSGAGGTLSVAAPHGTFFSTGNSSYAAAIFDGGASQTNEIIEVRNGAAANADIFSVSQNSSNLIANSSFETNTTGWTANGSSTLSQITSDKYSGTGAMQVATTALANDGAKFNYALAASTQYSFSVYTRATGANFSTLQLGYSADTTTQTSCVTAQTVLTTGWTRYTCTFTTSTVSGTAASRFVYVKQTDATARTFYIDAAQLEIASAPTNFNLGNISLNGTVTSPTTFQNQSNSTTAFQIQNAAGTNMLSVDTVNSVTAAKGSLTVTNTAGTASTCLGVSSCGGIRSLGIYGHTDNNAYYQIGGGTGGGGHIFQGASRTILNLQAQADLASATLTGHASQTANILEVKSGATNANLFSVGANGAILAKASVDSTNTFQIQNASGASAMNLNTAVNSTNWTATTSVTGNAYQAGSATYNGRIYITGGTSTNAVRVATPDQNGVISSWTTLTNLPATRTSHGSFAYNGYLYVIGGNSSSDVSYAQINGDGTIGSWTTTTSLPTTRAGMGVSVYNGRVYVTGGNGNGSNVGTTDVLYATINGDGTIGSWTTGTSFTTARTFGQSVVSNGRIYVLGGATNSNATSANTSVQFATINGDGTIGSWTSTTNLPSARALFGAVVSGGLIYITGGFNGAGIADTYSIAINGDGTLGSWSAGSSFSTVRYGHSAALINGYLYTIGGYNTGYVTEVLYSAVSSATYSNVLTVNALLNNTGPALFKNNADTTTAFQIQNAAGTSNLFVADTTNTRIAVGKATAGYTLDVGGDINSTTALRVGGNQVCDSTGCITSSTSGIKNQTSTQTANMNIQSASASQVTAVIQGAGAQTANILEVKSGSTAGGNVFTASQNTTNLLTNPGFETDTANWEAKGTLSTLSRTTSVALSGNASGLVSAGAASNEGVKYNYALTPSTTYVFTARLMMTTGTSSQIKAGYSATGATDNQCGTVGNVGSAAWRTITCTFTTAAGTTASSYIFLSNNDSNAKSYYIDNAWLEATSATGFTGSSAVTGNLQINGVISSPVNIRNTYNSSNEFMVQNSAGFALLNVDSNGSRVYTGALTVKPASSGLSDFEVVNASGINVLTVATDNGGAVTVNSSQGTAFNVANTATGADDTFAVSAVSNNLITANSGAEGNNTTGWSTVGSPTVTNVSTEKYMGARSISVTTAGSAGDGAKVYYSFASSTTYTASIYVKAGTSFSTFEMGYSIDTSTQVSCLTAQTVSANGWQRYSCTFTTGTVSGTATQRFLYFKQTDAGTRTFYLDNVKLESGSTVTNSTPGTASINGTVTSPAVFQNQSNSATAFQVQNAAGASLINVDTTTFNMASNASFETGLSGWTAAGSATLSRNTTQKYSGTSSMGITLVSPTNDGARLPVSLSSSTAYTISFYAMTSATSNGNIQFGRSDDGTTDTNCSTNAYALNNSYWQRATCTFTTGTVSGSPYIYIRSSGGAAVTYYIDAVQIEAAASATSAYQEGTISLNGVINSPVALRNQSNSTTAFSIQNAAGTTQMTFDTSGNGTLNIYNSANRALSIGNSKISNNASTLQLEATSGNMVEIVNSGSSESFPAFKVTGSAAAAVQAQIRGAAAQTADVFQVQSGNTSNNSFTVGQSNTNLLNNPSFDVNTTGWTNLNSTSFARTTAETYSGPAGLTIISVGVANDGIRQAIATSANTTYSLSFYVKSVTAFSTLEFGTLQGSTYTSCATGVTATTNWTRVTCTFTNSATAQTSVYVRQTDTAARTYYVDAFQLETGSVATNYSLGNIGLNGTVVSPTVFKNQSNSSTAFQIQNASSDQIFNVDTTTNNLIANPSFESSTNGWAAKASGTITQTTAQKYIGNASMQLATTGANDGVTYAYPLASATTYALSFQMRVTSGTTYQIGRSEDGTTDTLCASNVITASTGWVLYACSFTTGTVSGTPYIYIKQTSSGTRTAHIDAVQLELGSRTAYQQGQISLNGVIASPVTLRGLSDSTTAFQIQSAGGTTLLNVDTTNTMIRVGTGGGSANYSLFATDAARLQNVIVGGTDGASTLRGATGSGGTINLQNTAAQSFAFTSYASTTAANVFQFNATPGTTAENLLQVQRNGTAVATVGNSGSLLLRNQTDTNAAFQLQNAGGSTVLNVNTAINASTWSATNGFTGGRGRSPGASYNGYAYQVGGVSTSGTYLSDAQYTKMNGDGTMNTWTSQTNITTARGSHGTVAYNGNLYVLGGTNSGGNNLSDIQYAAINGNGSLGSWTTNGTNLTVPRAFAGWTAYNGYMYSLGGVATSGSTGSADVMYAPINGNGSVGSWTSNATTFSGVRTYTQAVAYNGYMYVIGGVQLTSGSGTRYNDVQYAPINGDGSLGAWSTATPFTTVRYGHSAIVSNGKLYVLGGTDGTGTYFNDVQYATLNGNGTVGSWTTGTPFTTARINPAVVTNSNYIYVMGGTNISGTYMNDVQYTTTSTVAYNNSFTFNGLLNNTGPASFQNTSDSTSAFSIQNASASSIFQVDTTNSRVGIGNATPGNLLSVGALTLADGTAQLAVGTGAVGKKGIVIQSVAGQTADFLQAQDSTGAVLAKLDKDGNLTVKTLTITAHIISGGSTPTLTNGVDLGTTPGSQTIEGTDTAGRIYFTAGTGPGTNGAMMRVNFATNYTNTPRVVLTPLNPDGSSAGVYLSDISSSGFTIRLRNPVNDTGYDFNYIVIQ